MSGSGPGGQDVVIDELLADLGFRDERARREARQALEELHLTNARKQRIAAGKLDAVKAALGERFLITCAQPACRAAAHASGKTVLDATLAPDCQICGGSRNRTEMARAIAVLQQRGRRRVVVVGGSPATRDELRALAGDALELRLISGTDRRTGRESKADLAWADVVVVWGPTELDHKVSKLYTDARDRRVVVCPSRGIAALAATLIAHDS
jgi:hypothetical protein